MLKRLERTPEFQASDMHYGQLHGTKALRKSVAAFMEKFIKISDVKSNNIVLSCGASAVLDALSMCLFNEGEALIVPAPLYPGFIDDFSARFNVKLIPLYLSSKNNFELNADKLEESIIKARSEGNIVKAVLICSPYNPLGRTLDNQTLSDIISVSKKHEVDIISDEIYANSVFNGNFSSLLELGKDYREHIHFVYGLAKDFSISGFKIGIFYSENQKLISAMKAISHFHALSAYAQKFAKDMLTDIEWCENFIQLNHKRLFHSYTRMKTFLEDELGIYVVEANAGIFIWADFSKYLKEKTFEEEMELFDKIRIEASVNISPGKFFLSKEPGWFRICYAQPDEYLAEVFTRLKRILC